MQKGLPHAGKSYFFPLDRPFLVSYLFPYIFS